MGEDKRSAYQTLYETLFAIAKLIAPFSPFLAEEIYRNLNSLGTEPWESVHLATYPDPGDERYVFVDEALEDRMRAAREVVTLCRSARNEAGIRVRQPLERTVIVASGSRHQEMIRSLGKLITEEVNVRRLEFAKDVSQLVEKKARPVFKNLGPKFGSRVNEAAEIIRGFCAEEIDRIEKGEKIRICLDQSQDGEVEFEDVEIVSEALEGLVVQSNGELTVALDTRLNDELVSEGLAREFVSRVQHMRREAGFQVTDRVRVYYEATPAVQEAIRSRKDYIQGEILAVSLMDHLEKDGFQREWEIEKEKIHIGIERVSI